MDLAGAIVGHLVGDFVFQNDWMAQNKKKCSFACGVHVLIYSACVMFFSGWLFYPAASAAVIFLVVAVPHFLIDRSLFISWWMRTIAGQKSFAGSPFAPWSMVVVDNTWHLMCLWLTDVLVQNFLAAC
jgi:hypothetical protein